MLVHTCKKIEHCLGLTSLSPSLKFATRNTDRRVTIWISYTGSVWALSWSPVTLDVLLM